MAATTITASRSRSSAGLSLRSRRATRASAPTWSATAPPWPPPPPTSPADRCPTPRSAGWCGPPRPATVRPTGPTSTSVPGRPGGTGAISLPTAVAYEEVAYDVGYYEPFVEQGRVDTYSGVTDADGTHYLQIDFESMTRPQPFSVIAEATVFDVNRQAWAGTTSLMVHPSELYVGLRSERTFVEQGEPLEIEGIVAALTALRLPTGRSPSAPRAWSGAIARAPGRKWKRMCSSVSVTSTTEPFLCTFETPQGGEYRISATVTDEAGRENLSEFTRWVSGGKPADHAQCGAGTAAADSRPGRIPARRRGPDPGPGAVLAGRGAADGQPRRHPLHGDAFTIEEGAATLSIPITEDHIPNLYVQVDLVGSAERSDDRGEPLPDLPPRPAYATGLLELRVPPLSRTLGVSAVPRSGAVAPGESTTLDVTVVDAAGNPVSGRGAAGHGRRRGRARPEQLQPDRPAGGLLHAAIPRHGQPLRPAEHRPGQPGGACSRLAATTRRRSVLKPRESWRRWWSKRRKWPWIRRWTSPPAARPRPWPRMVQPRRPSPCAATSTRWRPLRRRCAPTAAARQLLT